MPKGQTTIGAEHFHFRVRNGIGWFLLAIAARQTGSDRIPFARDATLEFGCCFDVLVAIRVTSNFEEGVDTSSFHIAT